MIHRHFQTLCMSIESEKTPRMDRFEPARRDSLRKIFNGVVYTPPVVASFSLGGLGGDAQAQVSNQTPPPGQGPGGAASQVPATSGFGIVSIMCAIGAAGALLIRRLKRR